MNLWQLGAPEFIESNPNLVTRRGMYGDLTRSAGDDFGRQNVEKSGEHFGCQAHGDPCSTVVLPCRNILALGAKDTRESLVFEIGTGAFRCKESRFQQNCPRKKRGTNSAAL